MNTPDASQTGRGLALGLAGIAAIAAAMLMFGQNQTWSMWAWSINQAQSAATLSVGFFGGALLLLGAGAIGTAGATRLAFLTTLTFSALALWVTFTHDLLSKFSGDMAGIVSFAWIGFLLLGAGGSVTQLVLSRRLPGHAPATELPRGLIAPVLIPGAVFGFAGLAMLSNSDTGHHLIPWTVADNDLRLFGAILLSVAFGCVMAFVERDANSLLGGALGAGALGFGMLFVAAQNRDIFPWTSTAGVRYELAAGVLVILGGIGLVLHQVMPNPQRWERFVRAEGGPRSSTVKAHADSGFFGPDSVAWRVWSYPTSVVMGFQRAVAIEELDPFLVAAVDATQRIREFPAKRYDYTLLYFATVAFGDTRSVVKASQALTKIHARNTGTEPLSGKPFDANNPESQLWILVTGWHSILKAYEMYGPGPLSEADEKQFWAACATAAEFQTIDPAAVPRSREELRAYYARVNPGLVASPVAVSTMEYLLNPINLTPNLPGILRPGAKVINRIGRAAVVATLPKHIRAMTGIDQPAVVDHAIAPWIRMTFGLAARWPWLEIQILKLISPSTIKVVEPVLYGVHPTLRFPGMTPAQAFAKYEVPTPTEMITGGH